MRYLVRFHVRYSIDDERMYLGRSKLETKSPRKIPAIVLLRALDVDLAERAIIGWSRLLKDVHELASAHHGLEIGMRATHIRAQPARSHSKDDEALGPQLHGILQGEHIDGRLGDLVRRERSGRKVVLVGHRCQAAGDNDEQLLLGAAARQERQEGRRHLVHGDDVDVEGFFQGMHVCNAVLLQDLDACVIDEHVESPIRAEYLSDLLDGGRNGVVLGHVQRHEVDAAVGGIDKVLERWSQAAGCCKYSANGRRRAEQLGELETEAARAARDKIRSHEGTFLSHRVCTSEKRSHHAGRAEHI